MGTMAGLLGVGGGIVAVPMLTGFLALTQHEAHGTSLAAMVPAAVFAVTQYASNSNVDWSVAATMAMGSVFGVGFGCRLCMRIPARQLRRAFGFFVLVVAARLLVGSWGEGTQWAVFSATEASEPVMTLALALATGVAAGVLAGLLGIGGGIVMIPAMVLLLGLDQHLAQGVSLAVVAVTATVGAFEHYRLGNVKLDRAIWIGPAAAIFGLGGAWLAGSLDQQLLQRLFGVLLLFVGGKMASGR
ncbi:MAG: sulfite exporter TauE/SafE family protein [Chloroflexi bacterium]|nr:sulfite exporter TauE/SafE family protein [Chloroflexota bacterium]